MLTLAQLSGYYSDLKKVSSKSILVEYLQYELLDSIYKQEKSKELSFMGGTAIRVACGGNRFSEDLDFDNFGLTFSDFQNLLNEVVRDMGVKGFSVEFRFVEKGAYHCYIKFPHILQNSGVGGARGEKILVRIDAVRKEKIFSPVRFTLNRFDIYRNILVNPADIILSQKMAAILQRKREKGRDFYDVSFLYGITKPDFSYIEKSFQIKEKELFQKLFEKCEKLDFKDLAKDVEPFLINPEQAERVADFLSFIKSKA